MRVLLATSDRDFCGVLEYGRMLMDHLPKEIEVVEWQQPQPVFGTAPLPIPDIFHLNHQASLSSGWSADHVADLQGQGIAVVVTQHDTFQTFEIMLERGFPDFRGADALIVHEPVEGLTHGEEYSPRVRCIRQGVLGATVRIASPPLTIGTCGFPFPWKGHGAVARAAGEAGWNCLLIAPGATVEQADEWQRAAKGNAEIISRYLPREEIVARLAGCTATAFLYEGGGSGTSGAIRLGLAARVPLLAYRNRQFRDLETDPLLWCRSPEDVVATLVSLQSNPSMAADFADRVEYIANRDSWNKVGEKYAEIYRTVLRER